MRKLIFFSIVIVLLSVTGYMYWYYYNPYSDGYREGILQKFSRKGNVLKTYEGEMVMLGFGARNASIVNANYFYFSVDENVTADSLQMCLGKIVKVHYVQYRRGLPWRGENYGMSNADKGQYIVDKVAEVRDAPLY